MRSWGCDSISIPPIGPEPLRAIVYMNPAWTWCGTACFYCLPYSVSTFELEFGLLQDVFKFHGSHMPHSWIKVPHTELVSDLEDNAKVAEVKAGKKQWRKEEVKVEH